jgi:hypothetical protein
MFSPTIKYLYESTSARPGTLAQLHVPYHWCYLPINPLSHQFAILTLHVIESQCPRDAHGPRRRQGHLTGHVDHLRARGVC